MGKATERQLSYAYAIADKLGIERPYNDFEECRIFISKYKLLYQKALKHSVFDDLLEDYENPNERKFFYIFTKDLIDWMIDNLTSVAGVYCFVAGNQIVYIGKSIDLAERITSSYRERRDSAPIDRILYYITPTKSDAHILEMLLIAENKPILNVDGKSQDAPQMFKSNIDILRDFYELKIN